MMVLGFIIIRHIAIQEGFSSMLLQSVFLWLLSIIGIILIAVNEDSRLGLHTISRNQLQEIKLLKAETALVKEELQLLRDDMGKKKRSR